jgi:hypothetical protein
MIPAAKIINAIISGVRPMAAPNKIYEMFFMQGKPVAQSFSGNVPLLLMSDKNRLTQTKMWFRGILLFCQIRALGRQESRSIEKIYD